MIDFSKRIVCAANRYMKKVIVCGPRHGDGTMHTVLNYLPDEYMNSEEQGFVNTWGQFLNRKDAWKVACYNNQIVRPVGNQLEENKDLMNIIDSETELFSENLY